MIVELRTPEQVRSACHDDDLVTWVAGSLDGAARAWALGEAVLTAAPCLARWDRMALWGAPAQAATLAEHAMAELGPSYRPLGSTALVKQVLARVEGLQEGATFSWMSLDLLAPGATGPVGWLPRAEEEQVAALLADNAPHSYAVPGAAGVSRWAGLREQGRLAAVAAEAWSAPSVGFLAGVATAAAFRGRGMAGEVCRWVSAHLMAVYGRTALIVDDANAAAITVYERLGYRRRSVTTCAVAGGARTTGT